MSLPTLEAGVTSCRLAMKQLVWNAGAEPLAARRRMPLTTVSAEVKVWAGKASTLKPLPCALDTRE